MHPHTNTLYNDARLAFGRRFALSAQSLLRALFILGLFLNHLHQAAQQSLCHVRDVVAF